MEHNPTPHSDMKDRLLRKIDARELLMRPKIYFTLQVAALTLVAIAVLLVSIFIFNFIFFSIRINSRDSLLGFGPRGIWAFLAFFPWMFLLVDVVLVLVLEWLLRKFRSGNRIPALYLLFGLIGLTVVTGLFIDRATGINDRMLLRSDEHLLPPPLDAFYGGARHHFAPESGICTCIITAIDGTVVYLRDADGTTTLTAVLPLNDPRATTTLLKVGDIVIVAGDRRGDEIKAFGVHRILK